MQFENNKMSRRLYAGGSLLLTTIILAGCGALESKKADYRSIQRAKPLDVPPELSAPAKDDRYTVSETSSKGTTFSSYSAERANSKGTPVESEVKIEKLGFVWANDKLRLERGGNQRWLVIPAGAEMVWPQLRRFVLARGLTIKTEVAEIGFIESDWSEKAAFVPQEGIRGQLARALGTLYSTSERDKYRFRLEPGNEPGTTELYISHRGVEEIYVKEGKEDTRWQPKATDPALEMELLGRFAQFLGAEEKKVEVLTQGSAAPGASDRARLIDRDGKLALDVDERFDRAWRRVGLALDRKGFTVEDRDRAKGLYFVRYLDSSSEKAVEKSWIDALAFWRDDPVDGTPVQSVYRISVKGMGEQSSLVEVQDKSGGVVLSASARKILDAVRLELK